LIIHVASQSRRTVAKWNGTWGALLSICCGAAMGLQPVRAAAQPSTEAPPTPGAVGKPFQTLAVSSGPQGGHPADTAASHSVGIVSLLMTSRLEYTFVLTNLSPASVALTDLRPSCGCTSALLDGQANLPLILLPGQHVSVRVTVDALHLTPGLLDKSVAVYVRGQLAPAAILRLVGTILPIAAFTPSVLDFGQTRSGQERSLTLAVQLDQHLMPAGAAPRLVSSDPDIQVTSIPPPVSTPPRAATMFGTPPDPVRTYRVTLSPQARIGTFTGRVSLVFPGSGGASDLSGGFVSLRGEVVGDFSAAPGVVAFGAVMAGQPAAQQVFLTGQRLNALRISSDCPYVTVHLGVPQAVRNSTQAFGAASGRTAPSAILSNQTSATAIASLHVTLSSQTPPETLETRVRVTAPGGQQMVIPVFALITPRKG